MTDRELFEMVEKHLQYMKNAGSSSAGEALELLRNRLVTAPTSDMWPTVIDAAMRNGKRIDISLSITDPQSQQHPPVFLTKAREGLAAIRKFIAQCQDENRPPSLAETNRIDVSVLEVISALTPKSER